MAKKRKDRHEVRNKNLTYRGKTLEELKLMDVRESAKFLKSRSKRAVLRNFNAVEKFIKRCDNKILKNKKIRTHLRDIVIVPKLVGLTIEIHNGQNFQPLTITLEMVGHRLGEFSMTRTRVNHGSAGIGATKSSRAAKK
jgi:small subunit ribosomal protein S19